MLGWRQAGAVTAVKATMLHVVVAVQKEPPDLALWSTVSQGARDRLVPRRRRPGLRELSLGSMKMMGFFVLAEFIYSHNLTVDGREILFHIWDVPSSQEQAEEGSSEEKRIQWADSFVLVYSICDRASFNILPLKIQFIKAAKEVQSQEKVPIVIVGNKRDLHHQRVVSSEEGRLLALSLDCGFYEVSAAEAYHGALMVFHGLAERIPDTKLALKKGTGIRGIVKTMSAVFARKRTDSL
ncbi:ras-related and estrogen-regulated growth inhibitor-like isoform 1-T1 [Morphnus guianensis]